MTVRHESATIDSLGMRVLHLTNFCLGFSVENSDFLAACRDKESVGLVAQGHAIDVVSMEVLQYLSLSREGRALVHENLARLTARVELSLHLLLFGLRVRAADETLGCARNSTVVHAVANTHGDSLRASGAAISNCDELLLCRFRLVEEPDGLDGPSQDLSSLTELKATGRRESEVAQGARLIAKSIFISCKMAQGRDLLVVFVEDEVWGAVTAAENQVFAGGVDDVRVTIRHHDGTDEAARRLGIRKMSF